MRRTGQPYVSWRRTIQFAVVYALIGIAEGLVVLFTEEGSRGSIPPSLIPDWHNLGDWWGVMAGMIPSWPIVTALYAIDGDYPAIAIMVLSLLLFVIWFRAVKADTKQVRQDL